MCTAQSACGENPSRVLGLARPETVHEDRLAFHRARSIRQEQDSFCESLLPTHEALKTPARVHQALSQTGLDSTGTFPGSKDENWDIEIMVSLLRGNVKAMTHCYTTLDMNSFLRVSGPGPRTLVSTSLT
jgi:hypothetical protein